MDPRESIRSTTVVLRWIARLCSIPAILALSAFFIEHLEWFARRGASPPARVFAAQGCHLLLLLGLAAAWRWEWQGAALALLGAAGFVAAVGPTGGVLTLVIAISFPAVAWIVGAGLSRLQPPPTPGSC